MAHGIRTHIKPFFSHARRLNSRMTWMDCEYTTSLMVVMMAVALVVSPLRLCPKRSRDDGSEWARMTLRFSTSDCAWRAGCSSLFLAAKLIFVAAELLYAFRLFRELDFHISEAS